MMGRDTYRRIYSTAYARGRESAAELIEELCGALDKALNARAYEPAEFWHGIKTTLTKARCSMGVGCDEAGVCYAAANGKPENCPLCEDDGVVTTSEGHEWRCDCQSQEKSA